MKIHSPRYIARCAVSFPSITWNLRGTSIIWPQMCESYGCGYRDAVVAREQRPAKSMRTHRSESRRAGEEVPFARGHSHRDIRSGLNIRRLNSQSIQEGQELMQHSFFTC